MESKWCLRLTARRRFSNSFLTPKSLFISTINRSIFKQEQDPGIVIAETCIVLKITIKSISKGSQKQCFVLARPNNHYFAKPKKKKKKSKVVCLLSLSIHSWLSLHKYMDDIHAQNSYYSIKTSYKPHYKARHSTNDHGKPKKEIN